MHQYIVNASIQIVPIVQDRHPYEWVNEEIDIIKQSGIQAQIGPFATVMEGRYDDVMNVTHAVNQHLLQRKCQEWIVNVQLQVSSKGDITSFEKVEKHR